MQRKMHWLRAETPGPVIPALSFTSRVTRSKDLTALNLMRNFVLLAQVVGLKSLGEQKNSPKFRFMGSNPNVEDQTLSLFK